MYRERAGLKSSPSSKAEVSSSMQDASVIISNLMGAAGQARSKLQQSAPMLAGMQRGGMVGGGRLCNNKTLNP